jgi:hypothetical protein
LAQTGGFKLKVSSTTLASTPKSLSIDSLAIVLINSFRILAKPTKYPASSISQVARTDYRFLKPHPYRSLTKESTMKNSVLVRSFQLVILFLGLATASFGQKVDTTKCGESEESAKKCVATFVGNLKKVKTASQDLVSLIKERKLEKPELKKKYEDARSQVAIVVTLLTRSSPDFTSVKREFELAMKMANDFSNDANTALTGQQGTGLGFLDDLASWFFDNGCKLLPHALAVQGCIELTKYLKQLQIKKAKWDSWEKVQLLKK